MKNLQPPQIIALLTLPSGPDGAEDDDNGITGENHGYSPLRRIEKEASIKSLIEALKTSDDNRIRGIICRILGWRTAISAIPAMAECLDSDSESLRSEAADALGGMKSFKAGQPLLKRFKIEESVMVKTTLALSLGTCRYKPAAKYLSECLTHPDYKLREFSAMALGSIGSREYLADLQNLLKTEGEPQVVRRVRGAIEDIEGCSTV